MRRAESNEFEAYPSSAAIGVSVKGCPLETKASAARLVDRKVRDGDSSGDAIFWPRHSFDKIESLELKRCAVLAANGAKDGLAVMEYKTLARAAPEIDGNSYLALVHVDPKGTASNVVAQYFSNDAGGQNGKGDSVRIVRVERICALEKERAPSVIIKDDRYAGWDYKIHHFGKGFASPRTETLTGRHGD